MVWFKVDDGFAFHPKVLAATNSAIGLWVRAGSWCGANLTGGALPAHMIGTLGAQRRDARRLVEVGLWTETEVGYQFNGWDEYQPTKAQIDAERSAARDRQRAYRERKRNAVTNAVTNAVSDAAPTRPDPTIATEVAITPSGDARVTAEKRATRLPASWSPTGEHIKRAREDGIDLGRELVKFRAYADEKGLTSKSWNQRFTRWLMNAADYARRDGTRPQARSPESHIWDKTPEQVMAEMYPDDA